MFVAKVCVFCGVCVRGYFLLSAASSSELGDTAYGIGKQTGKTQIVRHHAAQCFRVDYTNTYGQSHNIFRSAFRRFPMNREAPEDINTVSIV